MARSSTGIAGAGPAARSRTRFALLHQCGARVALRQRRDVCDAFLEPNVLFRGWNLSMTRSAYFLTVVVVAVSTGLALPMPYGLISCASIGWFAPDGLRAMKARGMVHQH